MSKSGFALRFVSTQRIKPTHLFAKVHTEPQFQVELEQGCLP